MMAEHTEMLQDWRQGSGSEQVEQRPSALFRALQDPKKTIRTRWWQCILTCTRALRRANTCIATISTASARTNPPPKKKTSPVPQFPTPRKIEPLGTNVLKSATNCFLICRPMAYAWAWIGWAFWSLGDPGSWAARRWTHPPPNPRSNHPKSPPGGGSGIVQRKKR